MTGRAEEYPWIAHYPEGIAWDAPVEARPLPEMLESAAKTYPRHTAIDFLGAHTPYVALAAQVRACAAALQQKGVTKGVRVALFLPNCPQFVIAYYAVLMAGGVVVNCNPLYSLRELRHQMRDSGARIAVTLNLKLLYPKLTPLLEEGLLETIIVSEFCTALPFPKNLLYRWFKKEETVAVPRDAHHVNFEEMLRCKKPFAPVAIDAQQDIALLQYTGGTTGVPKAAMLTHGNLYANCMQAGYWFKDMRFGAEVMMGALPLFHVFAMTAIMNFSVYAGLKMILHPKFDLLAVLRDIARKKPTIMPGVPTMFAAMLNSKSLKEYDLTSLKMCISGGAPLPCEVKLRFEEATGCKLVEGYGLSETAPIAAVNPLVGVNKTGSIGLPLPQTVIEIVSLEDGKTALGIEEAGEICIRGPQVMQGYWNKPEETALVLKNGRLHTGDIGKFDADGYFYVVDRLKEMIISGGYNIYPRNVEEAIYLHPDVAECAVVGIPHPQRGQAVKAFVVKKEGSALSEIGLRDFLREHLASYETPGKIEFRDSLPKSMIGKILKKELTLEGSSP